MRNTFKMLLFLLLSSSLLLSCGFKPQGEITLPAPMHRLYIESNNLYGQLVRNLKDSLRLSHVTLVTSPNEADTILAITEQPPGERLTSVSGTQQTRQYELSLSATFSVYDRNHRELITPQAITESRVLTVQSNQILGSSNESNLYYAQMRRTLAYRIMNQLGSLNTANAIKQNYLTPTGKRHT